MAATTTERINFGTGSLIEVLGGGAPNRVTNVQDITATFTVELKEAFSEGTWAAAVASGHGTIDITAKNLTINPSLLASATGGVISTGATNVPAMDEGYTVPTTPFQVTLANGTAGKLVANTLIVLATPLVGGVAVPTYYKIVAAGAEVAGQSFSVNLATGVLTFAAADAATPFQATYLYTSTAGTRVTVTNSFQNSQKTMVLYAVKRDAASVGAATSALLYTFFSVRTGGLKTNYADDAFTSYERSYKAFADSLGRVFTSDFIDY